MPGSSTILVARSRAIDDDFPIKGLKTPPFRKIWKQSPEIQTAEILRILRGIVTSNAPRNAVLSHIEVRRIHDLARVMRALGICGESLCTIVDDRIQLPL